MTNWKPSPDAKRRLLVSTAMLGALYTGYGRRAYAAGSCVEAPTGTYACTGAFTTSQIFDNSSGPLVVTGTSGFGVSSTTGNAVTLGSGGTTGGITFTDTDPSNIAISGASPFTPASFGGSMNMRWRLRATPLLKSIIHGRSKRWMSGFVATLLAGTTSAACVGRTGSCARNAAWPRTRGGCRADGCDVAPASGRRR